MSALHIFLSVFGVIFVAELPDKTALAALVLATRHRPLPVFLGAALALTVQSLIAVTAGKLLSFLPQHYVHLIAGGIFVISAVLMWRRKEEDAEQEGKAKDQGLGFWRTTWLVFGVVFIAEWGDLTQFATAALAANYHAPLLVFAASALALWAVAALAVFVGNRASKLISPQVTQKIAAVLFLLIGIALLTGLI